MSEFDDPLEPSQLDFSSEPYQAVNAEGVGSTGRLRNDQGQQRVKLYFGCCKVFAHLTPPKHILLGTADVWRTNSPRWLGLI